MFLTLCHQVTKLRGQQELCRVLVQDFGEDLSGSQAAKHYCIVFMRQSQAMQEADQFLNDLSPEQESRACQGKGLKEAQRPRKSARPERTKESGTAYSTEVLGLQSQPAGQSLGSFTGFFLPGSNYPKS